jgi:hypothetical protein
MVFWDCIARNNPRKVLFQEPNPLVDCMLTQASLKSNFSLNYWETMPSETISPSISGMPF